MSDKELVHIRMAVHRQLPRWLLGYLPWPWMFGMYKLSKRRVLLINGQT